MTWKSKTLKKKGVLSPAEKIMGTPKTAAESRRRVPLARPNTVRELFVDEPFRGFAAGSFAENPAGQKRCAGRMALELS